MGKGGNSGLKSRSHTIHAQNTNIIYKRAAHFPIQIRLAPKLHAKIREVSLFAPTAAAPKPFHADGQPINQNTNPWQANRQKEYNTSHSYHDTHLQNQAHASPRHSTPPRAPGKNITQARAKAAQHNRNLTAFLSTRVPRGEQVRQEPTSQRSKKRARTPVRIPATFVHSGSHTDSTCDKPCQSLTLRMLRPSRARHSILCKHAGFNTKPQLSRAAIYGHSPMYHFANSSIYHLHLVLQTSQHEQQL